MFSRQGAKSAKKCIAFWILTPDLKFFFASFAALRETPFGSSFWIDNDHGGKQTPSFNFQYPRRAAGSCLSSQEIRCRPLYLFHPVIRCHEDIRFFKKCQDIRASCVIKSDPIRPTDGAAHGPGYQGCSQTSRGPGDSRRDWRYCPCRWSPGACRCSQRSMLYCPQ